MKTPISFILFFTLSMPVMAQKVFEGIIVYKITGLHKKTTLFKEVHFKNGKLRCVFRNSDFYRTPKSDWLINFDSLLIAFTNSWNDTGYAVPLDKIDITTDPHLVKDGKKSKTILGFQTTVYHGYNLGGIHTGTINKFYALYADSLLFSIPSEYLTTQLAEFGNGRCICLRMRLDDFEIKAVSVTPQSLSDSLFLISRYNPWAVNREISDETMVKVDSTPPVQENDTAAMNRFRNHVTPKHNPPGKNTHKQPTKSPATKPKESVTYKKMP